MKKMMLLAAAALAVQAVPALAENGAKPHKERGKFIEHMFEKQDTDKDGVVSEAEYLATAKARFDAMDADKDGKLTREEIKAHHEAIKSEFKAKRGERKGKTDSAPPVTE
ncbi:MAG: hypothetical protein WC989_05090 [Micavibrio sp.]